MELWAINHLWSHVATSRLHLRRPFYFVNSTRRRLCKSLKNFVNNLDCVICLNEVNVLECVVHLVSKLPNGNYVVKRPAHQVHLSASPHVSLSSKLPKLPYFRQTHKLSACDWRFSISPCGWLRWHHVKICQLFSHADMSPSDWNGPYIPSALFVYFSFQNAAKDKERTCWFTLAHRCGTHHTHLNVFALRQTFGCMCWCWVVQTDDTGVDISNIYLDSGT